MPTEQLHEEINERAEDLKKAKRWSFYVAISTALMAVCAAIASSLAGHHSNEAVIEQIKASDQWAYYQAKAIKAEILSLNIKGKKDSLQLRKYNSDMQATKEEATQDEKKSQAHLEKHVVQSRAVTFFQIAIAISAISILSERKALWFVAIGLATVGVVLFISSFL